MMSSFGDNILKLAVSVPGVSKAAYNALLVASNSYAPGMLKLASICYNSLLNEQSKNMIADFIKSDPDLGKYYTKYVLLTGLMKNEGTDPIVFLKANEAFVTPILASLRINTGNMNVDSLIVQINSHVPEIISKMKENKALITQILGAVKTGGKRTRKSRRKRRRTFRR
jgi:hypothetical protein